MDNLPRISPAFSAVVALRAAKGLMTSPHDLAKLVESDNFGKLRVFKSIDNEPIGYISFGLLDPASFDLKPDIETELIAYIFDVLWLKEHASSAVKQLKQFIRKQKIFAFTRNGKLQCKVRRNGFKTVII